MQLTHNFILFLGAKIYTSVKQSSQNNKQSLGKKRQYYNNHRSGWLD